MTLYLKNATYIDWQTLEFRTGHLAVSPGRDGRREFVDAIPAAAGNVLDCRNRLVTKSFACGHHHI